MQAGEIKITDVSLTLTGIGSFANEVSNDLIIHQNGNSRLGDITVGGKTEIDGGSVQARKMEMKGNAEFTGIALNLSSFGDAASSVGGDLTIDNTANGEHSALGDITVKGKSNISGGSLTAASLATGSATLAGAIQANIQSLAVTDKNGSLDIGAAGEGRATVNANSVNLNGAPLTVRGESALQIMSCENGGNLDAGAINIPENGTISAFGDITADSAALGQAGAELAGANVTISKQLTGMKGGAITATDGNVTLENGAADASGSITANADIIAGNSGNGADLDGGQLVLDAGKSINAAKVNVASLSAGADINATDIAANTLKAGGNVTASAGSVNLKGEENEIGGDLAITGNQDSSLAKLTVGGSVSASGGKAHCG